MAKLLSTDPVALDPEKSRVQKLRDKLSSGWQWFNGLDRSLKFLAVFTLLIFTSSVAAAGQYLSLRNFASFDNLTSVATNPEMIDMKVNDPGVPLSALARDNNNASIFSNVFYEWSMSSNDSVGTLSEISGNIAVFYPKKAGYGDITVKATNGDKTATRSIPVVVRDTNGTLPPLPSNIPTPSVKPKPTKSTVPTPTPNPCLTKIGGRYVYGNFCPKAGNRTLYNCLKGSIKGTKLCAYGCKINPGQQDSCKPAPKPINPCDKIINGFYVKYWFCPKDGNNTIYYCDGKGNTQKTSPCAYGCKINPGQQDSCKAKPKSTSTPKPTIKPTPKPTTTSNPVTPTPRPDNHIFGAYGISTITDVQLAKDVGLNYGTVGVSATSPIGQAYLSSNLKEIPSLAGFVYKRACNIALSRPDIREQLPSDNICLTSYKSESSQFTSDEAFQQAVASYLQANKNNSLISNFILIDDWFFGPKGDGLAKPLLKEIHTKINEIMPGRKTICPFYGGLVGKNSNYNGAIRSDVKYGYRNFSKEGCDFVAIYIYGNFTFDQNHPVNANEIDWNMDKEIATIKGYLKAAGWTSSTPILGIPQAFGGKFAGAPYIWTIPNANTITKQSRNWCQNGASGLIFYTWNASGGVTASTSEDIRRGIKQGINECKKLQR